MESIVKQVEYLRREIMARDAQLMFGVLMFAVLSAATFLVAEVSGHIKLYRLALMFVVSGIFYVGRIEYLEKRVVPWVNMAEILIQSDTKQVPRDFLSWEQYLVTLKSRVLYLAPTDLLCGLAFFWILDEIIMNLLGSPRVLLSDRAFGQVSMATILFALVWVTIGRWAADK